MKLRNIFLGAAAGGCALGVAFPGSATAAISDADFNALKDLVSKQGQMLDQLQKTHDQDQQHIQQLEQQLGETGALATNAVEKAEAAGQAQATYPAPNPATTAKHNLTMAGDAEVQFGRATGQHATFTQADFAPIFLFRANDNILYEAGFDIMLQNSVDAYGNRAAGSSTSVSLSFATLDYVMNDYMTLVAGEMLLPLGTYAERGAGWLNKIPDDPMVRDFLPSSEVGAQLRGALPLGESGQNLTYAVYVANGPSSSSTNGTANAGDLDLGGNVGDTPNTHADPSAGGRIGWFLPFYKVHYDLELGISGQTGQWSDSGNRSWSAAVLDAALHLGPYFEAKGEYINTWVQTDDLGTISPNGLWVQASYKLAGLRQNLPLINNLELVARYDNENDGQGTKTDRYTAGYVYYLSNTLLLEGDYEYLHARGANPQSSDLIIFQLSYGF